MFVQTDRQTDSHADMQTDREREGGQRWRQTEWETDTERVPYMETDSLIDTLTATEKEKRHRYTDTYNDTEKAREICITPGTM